jgi:nucleotide-binding universal stress UspA family protein
MISFSRILCPVDFSEFSGRALDHAVGIARWYGSGITALYVLPSIPAFGPPAGDGLYPPMVYSPQDLQQFRDELQAFAGAHGVAALDTDVVQGNVTSEILRVAADLPADLIVMGTHGRSGFERVMLGSVTEKILRKARCPVLTVPARATDAAPDDALVSRVLCAVDFSPASVRALALAQSLAGEAGAKLSVLHVLEPVSVFEPVAATGAGEAVNADQRRDARQRLERLIDADTRAFADVAEVVVAGKAYTEILRLAKEQRVDLLVMGAHGGRPGVAVFGSTAAHVVRAAECPVLTVNG